MAAAPQMRCSQAWLHALEQAWQEMVSGGDFECAHVVCDVDSFPHVRSFRCHRCGGSYSTTLNESDVFLRWAEHHEHQDGGLTKSAGKK